MFKESETNWIDIARLLESYIAKLPLTEKIKPLVSVAAFKMLEVQYEKNIYYKQIAQFEDFLTLVNYCTNPTEETTQKFKVMRERYDKETSSFFSLWPSAVSGALTQVEDYMTLNKVATVAGPAKEDRPRGYTVGPDVDEYGMW